MSFYQCRLMKNSFEIDNQIIHAYTFSSVCSSVHYHYHYYYFVFVVNTCCLFLFITDVGVVVIVVVMLLSV